MARLVLLVLAAAHAFTAPARTVAHTGRTRSVRGRSLAMVTTTASIEMNNGQVGVISSTRSKVSSAEAGNVVGALERLRQDLDSLEINIGSRPRVSVGEGALLGTSVALSTASPLLFSEKVIELLVPSAALLIAAVGVSAEYGGRVATANGKEIAAASLRTAAEAEALLAVAERSKAVIPFTVGVSASAAAVSLVLPAAVNKIMILKHKPTEVLMLMPLLALFSSAVAALAEVEVKAACRRATSLGRRRFSSKREVGASWLSQTEMVFLEDERKQRRWRSFALGVLPAPLFGLACMSGSVGFRAIVTAAFAAGQTAFYLASAEYYVARAQQAVADKMRTAAVADTYANQASRVGALLPFTSALAGLAAAGAAVSVEIAPALSAVFPLAGAVVAAAAAVSKACCEADSSAARAACEGLASTEEHGPPPSFLENAVVGPLKDLFREHPEPRDGSDLVRKFA